MGLAPSTQKLQNQNKINKIDTRLTDEELKQSIKSVLLDSQITENTSLDTLGWRETTDEANRRNELNNMVGGFLSQISESAPTSDNERVERYTKYNLNNILPKIQEGGQLDDILESISEGNFDNLSAESLSEFSSLKRKMRVQESPANNSQSGGSSYDEAFKSLQTSLSESYGVELSTSPSIIVQLTDEDDDEFDDDDDSDDLDPDIVSEEEDDDLYEAGFSEATESSKGGSVGSTTSSYRTTVETVNSEAIDIKPFSSSDEYEFKYPTSSNRFN